jgi:hypothetical protein
MDQGRSGGGGRRTGLGELELSSGLNDTLVLVSKAELGQSSSSDEETGGVGGSPVGKTVGDTKVGQLLGRGVDQDDISLQLGVDNLADDLSVGDSDHESVLRAGVL